MDNVNRESIALDLQVKNGADPKSNHASDRRTTVRFTEEEWENIRQQQIVTGRSIPELLKNRFFKYAPYTTVVAPEKQNELAVLHRRMSNNLNQIAKVLNSGFREGWNNEFIQVRDDIAGIRSILEGGVWP